MVLLGRMNAEQKVASFLLEMADRLGTPGANGLPSFSRPLSRQQIADVLGLTIETVSRQFSAFKREGIIDVPDRRRVLVINLDRLQIATGDDADGGVVA